jgi:hypothetical protein
MRSPHRRHRRPRPARRDRHRHAPLPHSRPPGVLGQICAQARQSADRSKAASIGKGNPWLGGTLGEAATSAVRTKTFLASRYKRIVRRRGKQRTLVAVGNSLLTIAWHLLSDPAAHFTDLGPDWHDCLAPLRRKRQLIAELERPIRQESHPPRRRLAQPPGNTAPRQNPASQELRQVLPPIR